MRIHLIRKKGLLYLVQISVALISYGIYLFSVSPTIYWNDSGELVTATHLLGLAHSPSFPLYILLSKITAFLPIGSIAFRVNLTSGLFGCLTILILFNIIFHILGAIPRSTHSKTEVEEESPPQLTSLKYLLPAIAGSFILAFICAFWLQSVRAEVYTLNTFLAGLLIYLLLKWEESEEKEVNGIEDRECFLYLIALIYGLSLCNHSLLTVYMAPAILFILIKSRIYLNMTPKMLSISLLFLLLGLSLYLYLPVRSITNPIMDWNNPETVEQFLNAFSRKRDLGKFFSYSSLWGRIEVYFFMMIREFTFFLYWIGIVGIWRLFKKTPSIALFTALIFLFNTLGTVSSSGFTTQNPDISGYLTISYLIYAIWIGVGLKFLLDIVPFSPKKVWSFVNIFLLVIPSLLPLVLFITHFGHSNKNNHHFSRGYGMDIIRSIEDKSVFFLKQDNTVFSLLYLIYCEKFREDVRLFDQDGSWNRMFLTQKRELYPEMLIPMTEELRILQKRYRWLMASSDEGYKGKAKPLWGMKVLEQMVFENIKNFKVYWESGKYDSIVYKHLMPNGLIFRVHETEVVRVTDSILKRHDTFWNIEKAGFLENKEFLSDINATNAYSSSLYYLGNFFRKKHLLINAIDHFEDSIKLSPNKPQAINDLGFCYLQIGRIWDAEKEFLTVLELFGYSKEAHLNLGVVYARRGEFAKAKREWEMVLKMNPDSAIARKNLEKLINLPRKDTEYH